MLCCALYVPVQNFLFTIAYVHAKGVASSADLRFSIIEPTAGDSYH